VTAAILTVRLAKSNIKRTWYVAKPRSVSTPTVKKSVAAMLSQSALRKVNHEVCFMLLTTLTFVQHLTDARSASDTGPGWEYYLDMLFASRNGNRLPSFEDYYPAQRDYFIEQVDKQRLVGTRVIARHLHHPCDARRSVRFSQALLAEHANCESGDGAGNRKPEPITRPELGQRLVRLPEYFRHQSEQPASDWRMDCAKPERENVRHVIHAVARKLRDPRVVTH
jgi:hypothetical protein